jgi:hypothetical protein
MANYLEPAGAIQAHLLVWALQRNEFRASETAGAFAVALHQQVAFGKLVRFSSVA